MNKIFKLMLCILTLSTFALADFTQSQKVKTSLNILNDFGVSKNKKFKGITGIAIIPSMVKSGFIISGHDGKGIFVARNDDNEWSAPIFVDYKGVGFGAQAGYKSVDLILLFKSSRSWAGLVDGKGSIDITADAVILGAGEKSGVSTDLPEISAWVLERGKAKGVFLGVSINTSMMVVNNQDTNDYYERIYDIADIYHNSPKDSRYTQKLKEVLNKYFE
ncbi:MULTISPECIES: lipid-binding SYLF domain-containing protein [unclassified Campylobacter]|uniref:lipid-binding SYLF domain-containing protein n=1 Tax=unclassified Campylobacter TaxID=2593542 RepID=UPI00147352AF|nr:MULTISPECIES: lipid-binding SYLF domain-containing protein [unclassified Campylobacter]